MSTPGAADDARPQVAARGRHPRFCGKSQLHSELANLALGRGDAGLMRCDGAGFGLLVRQFPTIELRHPKLDEVAGDVMAALRIAAAEDPGPDILASCSFKGDGKDLVTSRAFSSQGPSNVSDIQTSLVQPGGFTPIVWGILTQPGTVYLQSKGQRRELRLTAHPNSGEVLIKRLIGHG